MVKITFITDHKLSDDSAEYKQGQEFECNLASANHFIRRGLAIFSKKSQKDKNPDK